MSNDIVQYHNNMNNISFAGFKEKELDLFFTICFKLREHGSNKVEISFNELKDLAELKDNPQRLKNYILQLNKKLIALNYQMEVKPNEYQTFVFFTTLHTNFNTQKLEVVVNEPFLYLLNNLVEKYTKFDLMEFVSLKSVYSKKMFKSLKQWETTKCRIFTVKEFREILAVPPKYRMSEVNKFVLSPIMEELPRYFPKLEIFKQKAGKRITEFKFTWCNRENIDTNTIEEPETIEEIQISADLNKVIQKAKQNRFLTKILSSLDNIEILVQMFPENDLIKGLLKAYNDITHEIYSLNYLIKTIKTSSVKKEKQLIVIQKPLFDTTPKEVVEEKIDITQEEFELEYQKYLKNLNLEDKEIFRVGFGVKYNIIPNDPTPAPTDIPESKLLGKNGKPLKGIALKMRLRKLQEK